MEFSYNLPVNLIFGRGCVSKIGETASGYGTKAMIITGGSSTKKSHLLDRVEGYLEKAGIKYAVFDKVRQNPLTTTAIEAAEEARAEGCDEIIGIGGGSIMDCAKAAAFIAVNDGDINDYIFGKLHSEKALPIILVPTTCGTGSEGNGFAVLTNPENGDKKSLRCNAIVASASIIDSECMMTMPKGILASVGFDALCHCMEAYISRKSQPMTDMMSRSGMELIGRNLIGLYEGEGSPDAWDAMSWASTLGGMVINTAGITLPHGMEHPASGLKNIVHGKGLAAITPVVMEETIDQLGRSDDSRMLEKFSFISECIGGKGYSDCTERIRNLLERLNMNISLHEFGFEDSDIEWMTENCLKVSAAGISNHPVIFDRKQISELYRKAM